MDTLRPFRGSIKLRSGVFRFYEPCPVAIARNNGAEVKTSVQILASGERMGERQQTASLPPSEITVAFCRPVMSCLLRYQWTFLSTSLSLHPTYYGPPVYNLWVLGLRLNLLPSSSRAGLYILITTPESSEAIYFLFTVAEKHFSRAFGLKMRYNSHKVLMKREQVLEKSANIQI